MSHEYKREREKILDLIVQHDPRTCPKIDVKVMSQQEIDKAYKDGSDVILEWGKVVDQILDMVAVLADDQTLNFNSTGTHIPAFNTDRIVEALRDFRRIVKKEAKNERE